MLQPPEPQKQKVPSDESFIKKENNKNFEYELDKHGNKVIMSKKGSA